MLQFRTSFNREIPTHLNEDFDHRRIRDAPVMAPLPFSVFECVDWYPTYFDATRFRRMQTNRNNLQVRKRLGEPHDTVFAG